MFRPRSILAAIAALLVYEHAIVRPDDLSRVNDAFFNVNVVVSLGLLGLWLLLIVLSAALFDRESILTRWR